MQQTINLGHVFLSAAGKRLLLIIREREGTDSRSAQVYPVLPYPFPNFG